MKRLLLVISILLTTSSIYSIGFTFGPYSNEKDIVEHREFQMEYYDFPIFIGGLNHKVFLKDYFFTYIDLLFNIHPSKRKIEDNLRNNYLLYLHNEYNYYPFKQKTFYIGTGLESIITYRDLDNKIFPYQNYYITNDFFGYLNTGISLPISFFEIGLKLSIRLLPTNDDQYFGDGEITLQLNIL
jgi:hypothetical protein